MLSRSGAEGNHDFIEKGRTMPCIDKVARLLEMQDIAAGRDGYCLSFKYVNAHTHLRWMCAAGHDWLAVPSSVKHQGTWCPVCHPGGRKPECSEGSP